MRIAVLLLAFIALSAPAAEPVPMSPPDKAKAECTKQGEEAGNEAVKAAVLQHPGDATIIKQRAAQNKYNLCMRLAGYASGPIRAR